MSTTPEERFILGIDERTADYWKRMTKALEKVPPPGAIDMDDEAFFQAHTQKAEYWVGLGDNNYFPALATTAPKELERFIKIAKQKAAEEAAKRYAYGN